MSLAKQLWLGIGVIVLLAFGSSFAVSTLSAKNYLEQQLLLKNIDNATTLALSMSQMPKEPVALELFLAAQFDAGHYQLIRLTNPQHKTLVQRQAESVALEVPTWFARLIPLQVAPGIAQVSDGWKQYGTLLVQSHTRFAYQALWNEMLGMLWLCLLLGAASGLLGGLLLKIVLRPLGRVVQQAEDMQARRFTTNPEPATREFAALVRAMNALSERVRTMLQAESARLEQVRQEAHYDALTGLLNRTQFMLSADSHLKREDALHTGALVITRIGEVAEINRVQGRVVTDELLACLGQVLNTFMKDQTDWCAGRLNGADLVLFAPSVVDVETLAQQLHENYRAAVRALPAFKDFPLPTGVTNFMTGESLTHVLTRADMALLQAESSAFNPVRVILNKTNILPSDLGIWRAQLQEALAQGRIKLAEFFVRDNKGNLLHMECPARIQLKAEGEWLTAGQFMPWATKLGLMSQLDRQVVMLALQKLQQYDANESTSIGINLSQDALLEPAFHDWLSSTLKAQPTVVTRLWLEFSEQQVFQHLPEFRNFCHKVHTLGCKIGLEHVGHEIARISELHDLGLDYVKVDGALIHGIDHHLSNQVFLRGLCQITHSLGLMALAEGVSTTAELELLPALGFQGATGPGVR